jgi:cytochrome c oxidase subunit II
VLSSVAIQLLVLGGLLYLLVRDPERRPGVIAGWFTFAGGLVLPLVTLIALLSAAFVSTSSSRASAPLSADVEVIARKGWWEIRYRNAGPNYLVIGATELHLPVGREVTVALRSFDGAHALWIPQLTGRIDLIPGAERREVLRAPVPGRMRSEETPMSLEVVAQPPEAYEAWLQAQRAPAVEPAAGPALRGRSVFMTASCALCHTVRGTPAQGKMGPDLTHLASRSRIVGGMFENNAESLEAWVVHAQSLKPGSSMPDSARLNAGELRELVAYLQQLK